MTMTSASDFLSENRSDYPSSFKFDEVGKAITGTLVELPRTVDGTDLNGDPQTSWVFEIETDEGEKFSVWAPRGKAIAKAIAKAMTEAGATKFQVGDRVAIKHTGLGTPSKAGFSPPKLYEAAYKPAAPSVAASDLL